MLSYKFFFSFLSTLWFRLGAEQGLDLTRTFQLPFHSPCVKGVLGTLLHGRGILAVRAGLTAVNTSLGHHTSHPARSQQAFHLETVISDSSQQHPAGPCRGEAMPGQKTWALRWASPLTRCAALGQSLHCEEPVFSRTKDPHLPALRGEQIPWR